MNIIDSLLSLFRVGPPQARFFFWLSALVWHVFLLFFKGKSIKTLPKYPKLSRLRRADVLLCPIVRNCRLTRGGITDGYPLMLDDVLVESKRCLIRQSSIFKNDLCLVFVWIIYDDVEIICELCSLYDHNIKTDCTQVSRKVWKTWYCWRLRQRF